MGSVGEWVGFECDGMGSGGGNEGRVEEGSCESVHHDEEDMDSVGGGGGGELEKSM